MIKERLAESVVTREEIDEIRAGYTAAAVRGSIMYFVMADLALIDPMYQYSLGYFKKLFNLCIEKSEKAEDTELRVKNINRYSLETIYTNVCRGLGLKRMHQTVVLEDTPSVRGMVNKVNYMVRVEEA